MHQETSSYNCNTNHAILSSGYRLLYLEKYEYSSCYSTFPRLSTLLNIIYLTTFLFPINENLQE